MKKHLLRALVLSFLCLWQVPAIACLSCNRPLQVSIFDDNFWQYTFYMALPFVVVGLLVRGIYKLK
ncbi:MAG: hypothetical protein ACO1O1_10330 [Adhaeribacter sp.]